MSQAVRSKRSNLSGPYGEADLDGERFGVAQDRCSYPPERELVPAHSDISELKTAIGNALRDDQHDERDLETDFGEVSAFEDLEDFGQDGDSDVFTLMVPPGSNPNEHLPGSIEEAIRQVLDQVPRSGSSPELPPEAYVARGDSSPPPAMLPSDEPAASAAAHAKRR